MLAPEAFFKLADIDVCSYDVPVSFALQRFCFETAGQQYMREIFFEKK